jgi:hypothetical protein
LPGIDWGSHSDFQLPEQIINIVANQEVLAGVCTFECSSSGRVKLAEIGKPKSNWELQGLRVLAAYILGFAAEEVKGP